MGRKIEKGKGRSGRGKEDGQERRNVWKGKECGEREGRLRRERNVGKGGRKVGRKVNLIPPHTKRM